MSKKILFFIFLLIIICLVSYVFYLNPGSVTVKLGSDRIIETPLALVLVVTFCFGLLTSALVALYFATKQKFALWVANKKVAAAIAHEEQTLNAKVSFWSGNAKDGEKLLSKVAQKQPGHLLSQVVLVENLLESGELEKARNVLEPLRSNYFANSALLILSAKLNEMQGNHTAALDNLSLILKQDPNNRFALKASIAHLKHLGRFDKAIELEQEYISLLSGEPYRKAQEELAELQLSQAMATFKQSGKSKEYRDELERVLRQHKDYPAALFELSKIYIADNDIEGASELLIRAFLSSCESIYIQELVSLWLNAKNPARAIEQLSSISKKKHAESIVLKSRVELAKLYLKLEMLEQAQSEITHVVKLATEVPESKNEVIALEAKLLLKQKSYVQACDRLSTIANLKDGELTPRA